MTLHRLFVKSISSYLQIPDDILPVLELMLTKQFPSELKRKVKLHLSKAPRSKKNKNG